MFDERSKHLRRQIARVLLASRKGHLGPALSIVEILRVLFDSVLRFDAKNPAWPERDRFILSKGHGCIALYVLLADKGFISEEALWSFCTFDSTLGGHPEPHTPGVEVSTGSLGHGLPIAVGMAIAIKPRRVFVLLGDGECDEGSVWEAAMAAAKHKLDNLVVLVDYNKQQSYGSTAEVLDLEPLAAKWQAFGFMVLELDGHRVDGLEAMLDPMPLCPGKPLAIICHTEKSGFHHKNDITEADLAQYLS